MRKSFTTQPTLNALDGIESLINWPALEPLLPRGKGKTGRPGYAALTLFRALLLGLWHNLSHVKLAAVLSEINAQLSSQNVILQEGRVAIAPFLPRGLLLKGCAARNRQ